MTATVQHWLAERIKRIDSVQKCVLGAEADIIVHSWRGILIHVHIVDGPIKPRNLKRIAQEATRVGIGSLFVVDSRLLPPDGARVVPDEWLLAVHQLTDDKIYAYRAADDEPHLFQAHLRLTTKGDERDVWHGPEIGIDQLPFFRIWIKTSSLKGDYLIANFAADPFWQNRDYRATRVAAEDQRRAEARGKSYEFGYGVGPTHGFARPSTQMELSYRALGLTPNATCDEVKTAFRRLALEIHPDVSHLPKDEAETRFRAISDAYNFIRDNNGCS